MSLRHVLSGCHAITQSVQDLKLPQVIREVVKALDCDKASVFILDEEKEQLVAEVASGVIIRIPSDSGIAITNDEVIVVNDTYADERFNKKVDKKNYV